MGGGSMSRKKKIEYVLIFIAGFIVGMSIRYLF